MKKKIMLSLALLASAGLLYKFSVHALLTQPWTYPTKLTKEGKPKTWGERSAEEKLEDVRTDITQFKAKLAGTIVERDSLVKNLNSPEKQNVSPENKRELNKTIAKNNRDIGNIKRKLGKLAAMKKELNEALGLLDD